MYETLVAAKIPFPRPMTYCVVSRTNSSAVACWSWGFCRSLARFVLLANTVRRHPDH